MNEASNPSSRLVHPEPLTARRLANVYVTVPARLLGTVDLLAADAPLADIVASVARMLGRDDLSEDLALRLLGTVLGGAGLSVEPGQTADGGRGVVVRSAQPARIAGVGRIRGQITLFSARTAGLLAHPLGILFARPVVMACGAFVATALGGFFVRFGAMSYDHGGAVNPRVQATVTALTAGLMLLSYLVHEFGHSAAALRYGGKAGRIGCGLYWMFPVLFADVSAAWTLQRRHRIMVDLGGVYLQGLATAVFAMLATTLDNPEIVQALTLCVTINCFSILNAANPVLKFDGYWVFSDFFALPNLRAKANEVFGQLIRLRRPVGAPFSLVCYSVLSPLYGVVLAAGMTHLTIRASHYLETQLLGMPPRILAEFAAGNVVSAAALAVSTAVHLLPLVFGPYLLVCCLARLFGWIRKQMISQGVAGAEHRLHNTAARLGIG
jgi:putative peptide zinc metalloprotease protein